MTYYYPTGAVLPPSDKPGIYGAYNGSIPVTVPVTMPSNPGIQYVQTGLPQPQAPPPANPSMPQPPRPQPPTAAPQTAIGVAAAAPYPVSSAAYGTALQPTPFVASAGLYQGASLAYPQHNMSPVAASPMTGGPYIGRSISPYAVSRMPGMPTTAYTTGTAYSVTSVPIGYPAGLSAAPTAPTYTISSPTYESAMPGIASQIRPQMGTTAISAYPAQAAGPPTYPAGIPTAQAVPGMTPGMTPAVGAPIMANPSYPGASPYPRALP